MDNLQIVTHSLTPAKVIFNRNEIAFRLDLVLDKYKGLVFTEETVADCKKTMAELRKGQKSLDDFRKDTKKKLTLSVTEFENDCKTLYKKFDEVIDPLKEQSDFFETNRRENKKIEVEGIIVNLIEGYQLSEKYSKDLTATESFLIASISIKKVIEELERQARLLRDKQDEEELDRAFIIETVERSNQDNDLNLLSSAYIRLMAYSDLRTIITEINEDSKRLVSRREQELARIAELEHQRIIRKTELENQRIAKEEEDKRLEEMVDAEISGIEEVIEETFNINDFEELPQAPQIINKMYGVSGNAEQIKDLETFLNAIFENWEHIIWEG